MKDMVDISNNNVASAEVRGAALEHTQKVKSPNNGDAKLESASSGWDDGAVVVDTKAAFVRTPDGVVHRRDRDGSYAPTITNASYSIKT